MQVECVLLSSVEIKNKKGDEGKGWTMKTCTEAVISWRS